MTATSSPPSCWTWSTRSAAAARPAPRSATAPGRCTSPSPRCARPTERREVRRLVSVRRRRRPRLQAPRTSRLVPRSMPVIDGEALPRGTRRPAMPRTGGWGGMAGRWRPVPADLERRTFGGTPGIAFRFVLDGRRPTGRCRPRHRDRPGRPPAPSCAPAITAGTAASSSTPDRLASGDEKARTGYAMTAAAAARAATARVVLGFLRHDRFQHRFGFGRRRTARDRPRNAVGPRPA